jgi:actin-related protein
MASEESPAEGDTGSSLLLNQPVVIDNGTATLKAGFAGSAKPKVRLQDEFSISCQMLLP